MPLLTSKAPLVPALDDPDWIRTAPVESLSAVAKVKSPLAAVAAPLETDTELAPETQIEPPTPFELSPAFTDTEPARILLRPAQIRTWSPSGDPDDACSDTSPDSMPFPLRTATLPAVEPSPPATLTQPPPLPSALDEDPPLTETQPPPSPAPMHTQPLPTDDDPEDRHTLPEPVLDTPVATPTSPLAPATLSAELTITEPLPLLALLPELSSTLTLPSLLDREPPFNARLPPIPQLVPLEHSMQLPPTELDSSCTMPESVPGPPAARVPAVLYASTAGSLIVSL